MTDEHSKVKVVFVTGCAGRREYAIAVGLSHVASDRVVAHEKDGRTVTLRRLAIPHDRPVRGMLVYGVSEPLPQAVMVLNPGKHVVLAERYRSGNSISCPSAQVGTVGSIG